MKAIHNLWDVLLYSQGVVLYPKDTQKWKQFTTVANITFISEWLCCIPKILKNESNSQLSGNTPKPYERCVVSQRYSKMKAIHNLNRMNLKLQSVVLYPKDTQKWKQFTTRSSILEFASSLCCIPKILKNESNSQPVKKSSWTAGRCVVSQRYSKMKAIHNRDVSARFLGQVVLYPKDTQKWKQFTTLWKLFLSNN